MKKRILAIILIVLVFTMVACGKQADKKAVDGPGKSEASDVKIGIITDTGGVNDASFNQYSWEGLSRAGEDFGITVKYLESGADSDYAPNIETFIDEDYDLIICAGYPLADALREKATENPDMKFAIIDDASLADVENVTSIMFENVQSSYLAGYAAGLTTETNKVGFVIGMISDYMNEFGYGYCAGALDANPDVEIIQANANSFSDPAVGKTLANNMITDGVDVIFHAAGGTGLGAIEACKEGKKWAIGVDSDQSSIAPETILTSAMKRADNACYDAAKAVLEGTFKTGVITYSLADGGVDIAPTTDNLDKDVLAKIEEIKQQIIAGEIDIPKDEDSFEQKYPGIYQLNK